MTKKTESPVKKIKPRGPWVLVKPDDSKEKTNAYGLTIPSNVEQEQKAVGTVIASSPDVSDVSEGDKIVYGVYSGETLKVREGLKDVEYKLVHSDDIIAFFN